MYGTNIVFGTHLRRKTYLARKIVLAVLLGVQVENRKIEVGR
jgi:hypothetical protein